MFPWWPKYNCQGNYILLGSANKQPKKCYFLARYYNRQVNCVFAWRFQWIAKEMSIFLGCFAKPPRN